MIVHGDRAIAKMADVVPPGECSWADRWILFSYRPTGPTAGEWRICGWAIDEVDKAIRWVGQGC